jgi:hypothetical protein
MVRCGIVSRTFVLLLLLYCLEGLRIEGDSAWLPVVAAGCLVAAWAHENVEQSVSDGHRDGEVPESGGTQSGDRLRNTCLYCLYCVDGPSQFGVW